MLCYRVLFSSSLFYLSSLYIEELVIQLITLQLARHKYHIIVLIPISIMALSYKRPRH